MDLENDLKKVYILIKGIRTFVFNYKWYDKTIQINARLKVKRNKYFKQVYWRKISILFILGNHFKKIRLNRTIEINFWL
jgi:hypothetical protein